MSRTTCIGSVIGLAGLVACAAVAPSHAADQKEKIVQYKPGKLSEKTYAKVGKKTIPFARGGKYHFEKNPKTLGVFEFTVEFNASDIHDEPDVNNAKWYSDMTLEMFNMAQKMFKDMGLTVTDKEALIAHESYVPIHTLSGSKGMFQSVDYRKTRGTSDGGSYTASYHKESPPGLFFYDLQATMEEGSGLIGGQISAVKNAVSMVQSAVEGTETQYNSLRSELAKAQNLDLVPRVQVSWGLESERKGTPKTGMTIYFWEKPEPEAPRDPNKKVSITFNSGVDKLLDLNCATWVNKKVDNRDGKRLSGAKVKAATLEMFQHQCNTVAATYKLYKAKYDAKKK